jgi:hypothetical protein
MSEDGKLIASPSNFDVLLGKSIDGGLLEDFNELEKFANELLLEGKIGIQDLHFVTNLGQVLGHHESALNLDAKTFSTPLSDEVKKSICEKILSSPSSRIWLVELAIDKKSSFHPEAKKLLASKSENELCEVVVESCIALIGSKRWTSSKALDKELKLRAAIIPKSWTIRELPQILKVAVELTNSRLLDVCGNWITCLLKSKKAVDLGQLIERAEFDTALSLLQLFKGTPLIQKNARGLLSLLVTNSGSNLADIPDSIWEGIEADGLITFLDGIRGPRSVLISGPARDSVLVPALERKFSSKGEAWELLKWSSKFKELRLPHLFALVADKRDRPALEASAITEFVDSYAAEKIQKEMLRLSKEFEDQLNTQRQKFEEEEAKLNGELKLLSAKHVSLEDRLRESMGASQGAHQADIRQGRLDILREMIKHLDSLRLICPLLEGISSTADELVRSIELSLTLFSVEIVGEVNSITTYNPEFFEYIGVKDPENCRILSSAYLIDGEGGEKLVLRKGVCSPIRE